MPLDLKTLARSSTPAINWCASRRHGQSTTDVAFLRRLYDPPCLRFVSVAHNTKRAHSPNHQNSTRAPKVQNSYILRPNYDDSLNSYKSKIGQSIPVSYFFNLIWIQINFECVYICTALFARFLTERMIKKEQKEDLEGQRLKTWSLCDFDQTRAQKPVPRTKVHEGYRRRQVQPEFV